MLEGSPKKISYISQKKLFKSFELKSITPHMGAEICGIDLSKKFSKLQKKELLSAFLNWKVLIFRNQNLDRTNQKDFAKLFGDLHKHPMQDSDIEGYHSKKDDPNIVIVQTKKNSKYIGGDGWHADVTCELYPPIASVLYMITVPEIGGGDTLFCNMALAYELLSNPIKLFLKKLSAVHDGNLPYVGSYNYAPPEQGFPKTNHPVVISHPSTKENILYVNSGFTTKINNLSKNESTSILNMLFKHIYGTPELTCRVSWEEKSLVIWDNRCTQHRAIWDYYPHTRYAERVSIVSNERPSRVK